MRKSQRAKTRSAVKGIRANGDDSVRQVQNLKRVGATKGLITDAHKLAFGGYHQFDQLGAALKFARLDACDACRQKNGVIAQKSTNKVQDVWNATRGITVAKGGVGLVK